MHILFNSENTWSNCNPSRTLTLPNVHLYAAGDIVICFIRIFTLRSLSSMKFMKGPTKPIKIGVYFKLCYVQSRQSLQFSHTQKSMEAEECSDQD